MRSAWPPWTCCRTVRASPGRATTGWPPETGPSTSPPASSPACWCSACPPPLSPLSPSTPSGTSWPLAPATALGSLTTTGATPCWPGMGGPRCWGPSGVTWWVLSSVGAHRCTLHPNDSLAMEGPLSRVKSLKKSLRQSFRRIRKSRVSGKKRLNASSPSSKVGREWGPPWQLPVPTKQGLTLCPLPRCRRPTRSWRSRRAPPRWR